MDMKTFLTSY